MADSTTSTSAALHAHQRRGPHPSNNARTADSGSKKGAHLGRKARAWADKRARQHRLHTVSKACSAAARRAPGQHDPALQLPSAHRISKASTYSKRRAPPKRYHAKLARERLPRCAP